MRRATGSSAVRVWWGLALVVLCIAASVGVQIVQEEPASLHGLGVADRGSPPNETIPWDGREFAVAFLTALEYNATRDATLAGTLVCSHRACGPLVWVEGNVSGYGPFLLRPTADVLTFEDLRPPPQPPRDPASSAPTFTTPTSPSHSGGPSYEGVTYAIAEPFEARPALPVGLRAAALAVAPLFLVAFAPAGLAWWKRGLFVLPVATGGYLASQAAGTGWGVLGYLAILGPALLISAPTLVIMAILLKRISPWALGVLLLSVAFFVALSAVEPYVPFAGWGD